MRALVLGGSGQLGRAFVGALLDEGHRVTAVARRARTPFLDGLAVRVLRADLDGEDWLSREVERHDLVIDAAAPHPVSIAEGGSAMPRALVRVRRVVQAAREHRRPLVFVGSFSTLARERGTAAELLARARRRAHPYFTVKQAIEAVVLEASERGLRAVIVNPTACFGPWDDRPRDRSFVRALLAGAIPFVVPHPLNVVDPRDVATFALRALAAGMWGTPLLCAGHDTDASEVARIIASHAGVQPPPSLPLPGSVTLLSAVAYGVEQACAAAGVRVPPTALAAMLLSDMGHVGPSPAMRALGVRPRPLRRMLADAVSTYSILSH
jgi:nucleoside-diphosphate-sugar epimerase